MHLAGVEPAIFGSGAAGKSFRPDERDCYRFHRLGTFSRNSQGFGGPAEGDGISRSGVRCKPGNDLASTAGSDFGPSSRQAFLCPPDAALMTVRNDRDGILHSTAEHSVFQMFPKLCRA